MRRKYTSESDESDVDMTPMLDIVFIMLIFFIVSTSFLKEKGIEINRPSANPPAIPDPKPPQNVLITITANNQIQVGSGDAMRVVSAKQVGSNIESMKATNPKTMVIVKAHDISSVDTLMGVLNAAKKAGVPKNSISVSNYNK